MEQAQPGVTVMTKKSANLACVVVVIDVKSLVTRVVGATDSTNTSLGVQHTVKLSKSQPVILHEVLIGIVVWVPFDFTSIPFLYRCGVFLRIVTTPLTRIISVA
jgi:hypothetical protein